jgi:small subunit ribosomal protein S5
MSTSRPSQCLLCSFSRCFARSNPSRRNFHSSPSQFARQSGRRNGKGKQLKRSDLTPDKIRGYTEAEEKQLSEKYTNAQRAAIEVGEKAIDPKHLSAQASPRLNHWSLKYLDDLSKIDPVVDHPVRAPWTNLDPNLRLKTEDELDEDLAKFIQNLPPEDSPEADDAWLKFDEKLRLTVGKPEAEHNTRSAEAPEVFRAGEQNLDGKVLKNEPILPRARSWTNTASEDPDPGLLRLMQMTGFDRSQITSLRVKAIITRRVVNQTRLGKIGKMYYLTVAGNGDGLIGIGEGKSDEASEARLQSQYRAIRNMQPILRYERRTILGDVKGKVSATELELYHRPPGKYSVL